MRFARSTSAIDEGHTEVVDADLSKYFDTIPHSALMTCVARRISDGKMLHLIKMWLKAPVEETDERGHRRMSGGKKATRGTPQGGVASPLLANIYMHRFIKAFRQYGLGPSVRRGAGHLRRRLRGPLSARGGRGPGDDSAMDGQHRARAERGQDAVRNARCESFDFLGYTFGPMYSPRTGGRYNGARPSKKAVASIKDAIRQRLRPGNQAPWEEVVRALNRTVRGWCGLLLLRLGDEGAARCAAAPVPHGPSLSPPPAQGGRVWLSAVSHACRVWGTGCRVAADASRARRCACRRRETRPRAG